MTSPARADLESEKRRYLLGLAKDGASSGSAALGDFAMVAMRSRFERPQPPALDAAKPLPADSRPLISDAARQNLLRTCTGKGSHATDQLAAAAAHALRRSAVQLHPFDFSRLEDFVVHFASQLGPRAEAWARIVRPGGKETEAEATPPITSEEEFIAAGHAARLAYLRILRASEPDRARALIERVFAEQAAGARAELLDVLQNGLGPRDLPFIEAARSDRAQTVRDKATALIERIPGTDAYEAKLARLKDHLKVKTALLSRRKSLSVSGLGGQPALPASLFDGTRIEDIGAALGLSVPEFAALAAETPEIAQDVLQQTAAERRFDLIPLFETCLASRNGLVASFILQQTLPLTPVADREMLVRACMRPRSWTTMPHASALEQIHSLWRRPLPLDLAEDILASAAWAETLDQTRADAMPIRVSVIEAVASLIPRQLSGRFINDVAALAPRAATFHRFLLALPESD